MINKTWSELNEKHQQLVLYLLGREPFKATLREIVRDTRLDSVGSASFALNCVIANGFVAKVGRSKYVIPLFIKEELATHMTHQDNTIEEILKNYITKHGKSFFGSGKPVDAIRIRDEAKQAILSWHEKTREAELRELLINELERLQGSETNLLKSPTITKRLAELKHLNGKDIK